MTDQYAITRLHDLLAAANAEIARLSAHIVRANLGECVCGAGLGGRGEGATGWTVDVPSGPTVTARDALAGYQSPGYSEGGTNEGRA